MNNTVTEIILLELLLLPLLSFYCNLNNTMALSAPFCPGGSNCILLTLKSKSVTKTIPYRYHYYIYVFFLLQLQLFHDNRLNNLLGRLKLVHNTAELRVGRPGWLNLLALS